MSGVATPPVIVKPFGATAAPPYILNPIPVAPTTPGKASFNEGFPPATMIDPTSGGVPPSGADFNGILYMLSAFCAMLQAGQGVPYNATASTAFTGYKVGAIVRSVSNPLRLWINTVDGNTNDPDSVATGWQSSIPLYVSVAPTIGAHANVVLPGPSDYIYDVDSTAGAIDFSGFVAQRDGQRVTISNTVAANLVQILALNAGSTAGNRVRAATDLAIIQNQSLTIQYSTGAGKWLVV